MVQAVADLAQVRLYRGDSAASEKLLKDLAARQAWASSPEPSRLLGELYAKMAKHDLAADAFRQAYEKSGHAVNLESRLATALVQAGKPAEALKVLNDNTADAAIARARVELLIKMNRADEAETELIAALRSHPDSLELKNALAATLPGARAAWPKGEPPPAPRSRSSRTTTPRSTTPPRSNWSLLTAIWIWRSDRLCS